MLKIAILSQFHRFKIKIFRRLYGWNSKTLIWDVTVILSRFMRCTACSHGGTCESVKVRVDGAVNVNTVLTQWAEGRRGRTLRSQEEGWASEAVLYMREHTLVTPSRFMILTFACRFYSYHSCYDGQCGFGTEPFFWWTASTTEDDCSPEWNKLMEDEHKKTNKEKRKEEKKILEN